MHVPPLTTIVHARSLFHHMLYALGFLTFGMTVNVAMHRVSVECKKRGCPRVIETRDVGPNRKLKLFLYKRRF